MGIGQDLLNVPMGDMIREMAFAIADAQLRLDQASMETAEMMGGLKTITDDDGKVTFDDSRIFFGAEYMTIREALVTQMAGDEHDAIVEGEIGKITLPTVADLEYKVFNTTTDSIDQATASASDDLSVIQTATDDLEALIASDAVPILGSTTDPTRDDVETAIETNNNVIQGFQAVLDEYYETEIRIPSRISMIELGFSPVFYNFVDTIIEVKISISMKQTSTVSGKTYKRTRTKTKEKKFLGLPFLAGRKSKRKAVTTTSVTGRYSNTYSYSAEGSSLLRTKLVPVPQPPILEERIHALMDAERERRQAKFDSTNTAPVNAGR